MDLSAAEIRVLGCLLEKQRTTPDQYPLTLNSLRLACNQSTNRDPVVAYDEDALREALRRLDRRGYIRFASGHSSRASKYRHLLSEALPMSDAETAVMCVLMLRGAQTPGELKQRTDRMHPFESLAEVIETLDALIDRELAERLERRPGQKEDRYAHLLDRDAEERGDDAAQATAAPGASVASPGASNASPGAWVASPGASVASPGAWAASQGASTAQRAPMAPPEDLRARVERLEREVAELRGALAERDLDVTPSWP